jgi:hypothetical protein
MRQKNYKPDILVTIKEIFKKFPDQLAGTHLTLAFSDYKSIDGISDKEIYFLLEKYRCEKELDIEIPHDSSIEQIMEDAKNLTMENIYQDEEEEF